MPREGKVAPLEQGTEAVVGLVEQVMISAQRPSPAAHARPAGMIRPFVSHPVARFVGDTAVENVVGLYARLSRWNLWSKQIKCQQ